MTSGWKNGSELWINDVTDREAEGDRESDNGRWDTQKRLQMLRRDTGGESRKKTDFQSQ